MRRSARNIILLLSAVAHGRQIPHLRSLNNKLEIRPPKLFHSKAFYSYPIRSKVGISHSKASQECEDSWAWDTYMSDDTFVEMAAVFDGHGLAQGSFQAGADVSREAAKVYPNIFRTALPEILKRTAAGEGKLVAHSRQAAMADTLIVLDRVLWSALGSKMVVGGTTASILAVIDYPDHHELIVSNVGDSRAVALFYDRRGPQYMYSFYVQLTTEDNIREPHARKEVFNRLIHAGYRNSTKDDVVSLERPLNPKDPEAPTKFVLRDKYFQAFDTKTYRGYIQLTATIGDYDFIPAKRNYQPANKVQVLRLSKDLNPTPEGLVVLVMASDGLWEEVKNTFLGQNTNSIQEENHHLGFYLGETINQAKSVEEIPRRVVDALERIAITPGDDTTYYVALFPIKRTAPSTVNK